MTKREIATLSFKVLSIYSIIQAIETLPYVLRHISSEGIDNTYYLLMKGATPLLLILCGVLLWFVAPLLASSIFRSTASENEPNASLTDIQGVAFSVVGLTLLAYALPDLVNVGVFYTMSRTTSADVRDVLIHEGILASLKLVLGLWLLLGSRGLVNFIRSMRRD